ncbi:MAG TPA: type II toxin-antitoxin system VapC family toxin [Verrucomicrobiae bacterium]|nr:type II toxin-antitoxin system VapC family toxin [Verrucomicrobiae bacterium]
MTNYLLDTNALSEAPKKAPDGSFMEWFASADELNLFTSCLVLGEIKKGISLNTDGDKQKLFNKWLAEIVDGFDNRIIEVDKEVCLLWGELTATGQRLGKTPPAIDALIAAQCLQHNLVLVTRNVKDFEQFSDLKILCPWSNQ